MRPKFQCRFRRASERLFERQRGMRNPSSPPSAPAGGRGGASGKATPCCSKVGLKRGPWTAAEDELLASYIHREGEGRWRTLPKRAGLLRCGKSCRLRWMNYLRPSVKRGHIAADEEDLILRLHRLLGNKWSLIAGRIPGRTDNEIKNYWNTHLSKKLISQGIDPRTHKPLSENPISSASPTNHHHPLQNPSSSGHGDRYFEEGTNFDSSIAGLRNLEGSLAMGLKRVNAMGSYGGDEEAEAAAAGTIRCGVDDGFSSFFNSLINEEAFSGQHETDALGVQHAGNDDDNHL